MGVLLPLAPVKFSALLGVLLPSRLPPLASAPAHLRMTPLAVRLAAALATVFTPILRAAHAEE